MYITMKTFSVTSKSNTIYRVGQTKPGPLYFTACNFRNIASNLAQIKVISFLTLNRNLFESSLKNRVAPSSE